MSVGLQRVQQVPRGRQVGLSGRFGLPRQERFVPHNFPYHRSFPFLSTDSRAPRPLTAALRRSLRVPRRFFQRQKEQDDARPEEDMPDPGDPGDRRIHTSRSGKMGYSLRGPPKGKLFGKMLFLRENDDEI